MFGLLFLGKSEGAGLLSTSYHFGKHEKNNKKYFSRNNDSRVRRSPRKFTKITDVSRTTWRFIAIIKNLFQTFSLIYFGLYSNNS